MFRKGSDGQKTAYNSFGNFVIETEVRLSISIKGSHRSVLRNCWYCTSLYVYRLSVLFFVTCVVIYCDVEGAVLSGFP